MEKGNTDEDFFLLKLTLSENETPVEASALTKCFVDIDFKTFKA